MQPSRSMFLLAATLVAFWPERSAGQCAPVKTFSFEGDHSRFGGSLALDGDDMLVGAPQAGSVWFFTHVAGIWVPTAPAAKQDPTTGYGSVLALSGELAAIGAPFRDTSVSRAGAVEIWSASTGVWTHVHTVESPSPVVDGNFGYSVDIDGLRIVIGEPGHDNRRGRAWVFDLDSTGKTTLVTTLMPTASVTSGSEYGYSVAISAANIVVGAPFADQAGFTDNGAAVFFRLIGGVWTQKNKFSYTDYNSHVGAAVACSGSRSVIGVPYLGAPPNSKGGHAWIVEWNGNSYAIVENILNQVGGYKYGSAVAIDGPRVVVGMPDFDEDLSGPDTNHGGFQLFIKQGAEWVPSGHAYTLPSENLGAAVAVSGPRVVAGVPGDDESGPDRGAFYTYEAAGTAFHVEKTSVDTTIPNFIFGPPELDVDGSLCPDEPTRVEISNVPPLSLGWIVVGFSAIHQPIPQIGGLLGPKPQLLYSIISGPGGGFQLSFPWANGLLPEFSIYVQAFFQDGSTPQGVSASRTLWLRTPF